MNNKNIMGKDCLNLKNAGDEQEKHIAQKKLQNMAGKLSHADVEICNRRTEMSYQAFLKANPLKANQDEENV